MNSITHLHLDEKEHPDPCCIGMYCLMRPLFPKSVKRPLQYEIKTDKICLETSSATERVVSERLTLFPVFTKILAIAEMMSVVSPREYRELISSSFMFISIS